MFLSENNGKSGPSGPAFPSFPLAKTGERHYNREEGGGPCILPVSYTHLDVYKRQGKYRIIDFPLSNCVNSGIDTVGVLTQYRPLELNSYIGNGQPWDLDRSDGGVHILPPYMREGDQGTWYKGTANAIYQNIGFLDLYDPCLLYTSVDRFQLRGAGGLHP